MKPGLPGDHLHDLFGRVVQLEAEVKALKEAMADMATTMVSPALDTAPAKGKKGED